MNRRSLRASVAVLATVTLILALTAITPAAAKGARKIGFSSTTYSVTEGDGTATITITRNTTRGAASVVFYTGPSSSASTDDFAPVTSTPVSFADGETSATASVTIKVDGALSESDETVPLVLSTPSKGYKLGTSSATLTIHEMPVPPAPTALENLIVSTTQINWTWQMGSFAYGPVTFHLAKNSNPPPAEGRDEYWIAVSGVSGTMQYTETLQPPDQPGDDYGPWWYAVRAANREGAWGPMSENVYVFFTQ